MIFTQEILKQIPYKTLTQITEEMDMDYSLASVFFKEEQGMGFRDYKRLQRIKLIQQDLLNGFKLREIAGKWGCHPSNIIAIFKKQTGMTPRRWRIKNPKSK